MTPVLYGLVVCMAVAVAVVAAVALPHVRGGSRILSEDGERRARRVAEKARSLADGVAEKAQDAAAAVLRRDDESVPDASTPPAAPAGVYTLPMREPEAPAAHRRD